MHTRPGVAQCYAQTSQGLNALELPKRVRDADNGADPAITFGWADEQSLVDGIDGYEDGRLAVPNLGDEEVLQRLLAVAGDGGNSPDPSS